MYICGIDETVVQKVDDLNKIKISTVEEIDKIGDCYEALCNKKLVHLQDTDEFEIISNESDKKADIKETSDAAGRLCSRITSLIFKIERELEDVADEPADPKNLTLFIEKRLLDKLISKIIIDHFSATLKVSVIRSK